MDNFKLILTRNKKNCGNFFQFSFKKSNEITVFNDEDF